MKWYHPKNALLHIIDGGTFFIGIGMCSFAVIIPSYVKSFTDNAFLLALVPVIIDTGMYAMQPVSTYLARYTDSRHTLRIYFIAELIHRLSFIIIGVSIFIWGGNSTAALISFFLLWIASNFSWGIAIPHWVDTLSLTIPDAIRASFLGDRELITRTLGVLASLSVPFILGLASFPQNYAWLFIIAGLFFTSGAFAIPNFVLLDKFQREKAKPESFFKYFVKGIRSVLSHKNLLPYLSVLWTLTISRMTYAYLTPFIMEKIISKFPAHQQSLRLSIINTSLLIFQALTAFITGKIIHKKGHKAGLIIAIGSLIFANIPLLLWPTYATAILSQFFIALFMSSSFLVSLNTIMDFSEIGNRSRIMAFSNVINTFFIIIAGFIGGLIANRFGYSSALWLVGITSFVILILVLLKRKSLTYKPTR